MPNFDLWSRTQNQPKVSELQITQKIMLRCIILGVKLEDRVRNGRILAQTSPFDIAYLDFLITYVESFFLLKNISVLYLPLRKENWQIFDNLFCYGAILCTMLINQSYSWNKFSACLDFNQLLKSHPKAASYPPSQGNL